MTNGRPFGTAQVMEPSGVVTLDHERVPTARGIPAGRLGGRLQLAHLEVLGQLRILGSGDGVLALRTGSRGAGSARPRGGRGIDPARLGRGDLVVPGNAQGVEGRGDVLRLVQHAAERVGSLEPRPDRGDGEVLGANLPQLHFLPGEGSGDRGAGLGSNRIDGGDIGPHAVHVVVDEDLAGALPHLPLHGHAGRVGLPDEVTDPPDHLPDLRIRVPLRDGHVDLHPGGPGGLGIGGQPEVLARHPYQARHHQHVFERRGGKGIEVEEQVVGRLDRPAGGMEGVELDAAEVGHEQEAGRVLDHQVVDHLMLRRAPSPVAGPGALHGASRHPRRGV